jgi:hypothetical protein
LAARFLPRAAKWTPSAVAGGVLLFSVARAIDRLNANLARARLCH